MYKIYFDSLALDFLQKVEKSIAKRVWNKIMSTKNNPFHYFERLTGRKDFKLRVGDYRVIADIDQSNEIISVTMIGHRKDIYKGLK